MGSSWRKAGRSRPVRAAMAGVAVVVSGLMMVSCSPSAVPSAPGTPAPAAPSGATSGPGGAASRPSGVISLNTISALRSLFNRADGHTRLVLIFSPT